MRVLEPKRRKIHYLNQWWSILLTYSMYYVLWLSVSKWKLKSHTKPQVEGKVLLTFISSGIAPTLKTLQSVSLNAKFLPRTTTLLTACGYIMMTSSNGNIFRVTGPLYGEFTGYRTRSFDVIMMSSWRQCNASIIVRHQGSHYSASHVPVMAGQCGNGTETEIIEKFHFQCVNMIFKLMLYRQKPILTTW